MARPDSGRATHEPDRRPDRIRRGWVGVSAPLQVERYVACTADVAEVWALVGDLSRLEEWTDARLLAAPAAWQEGATATIELDGQPATWQVLTWQATTWELVATLPTGRFAAGCHVAGEGVRTRLVLAATLEPAGSRWKARTVEVPLLARRLERWAGAAVAALAAR